METKNIKLTLLYENGYGKLWINKDYHVIDLESENPNEFFENLAEAANILGEEVEGDKSLIEDFISTYTAVYAIQSCELIHRHLMSWDPKMAAIEQAAKDAGINLSNPFELMKFVSEIFSNL